MAIKECRECGAKVSTTAKSCPHCGASRPDGSISTLQGCLVLLVIGFVGFLWIGNSAAPSSNSTSTSSSASPKSSREEIIRSDLSYLMDKKVAPEIEWMDVDGNNVYIGFKKAPRDLSIIIRAAALSCNKAINFGCHVWAVPSNSNRPWRPGAGRYYEEVTARYGRIED